MRHAREGMEGGDRGAQKGRGSEGEKRLGFGEPGFLDYYWARPIYCGGHTQTPQKIEVLTEADMYNVTA